MNIPGKHALVMGGTGVIGSAVSLSLATLGITVTAFDLKDFSDALPKGLREAMRWIRADLSDPGAFESQLAATISTLPPVDLLVNCAGITPKTSSTGDRFSIGNTSLGDWSRVMDINLTSCFLATRAVWPTMVRQSYGRIVNVGSISARMPWKRSSAQYVTSKAAIMGLTKACATEGAPHNIRVNSVNPGRIASPLNADVSPQEMTSFLEMVPLSRLGSPQEVADVVLFLLSKESDYMTGCALDVNGGIYYSS